MNIRIYSYQNEQYEQISEYFRFKKQYERISEYICFKKIYEYSMNECSQQKIFEYIFILLYQQIYNKIFQGCLESHQK